MRLANKPRFLGRRAMLGAASSALALPSIHARAQAAGVALVIGNSKYHWEAQLPNVQRDAPDVARAFQGMGLKTELVLDATRDAMNRALDKLKSDSQGANFAAVYFAGHGASWDKEQYLVPVDADLSDPSAVKSLVKSTEIGISTKPAHHRLVVFDNCRNNPADGWRQKAALQAALVNPEAQRARIDRQPNTLVLFSTAPGRVALDGPAGQNSPFAAAFMRHIQGASVDIQSISSKIRRDLLIATEGQQIMWDRNGYAEPFVLKGSGRAAVAAPAADPSRIVELPKVYAFARENGLPLPSGLVALRPAGTSPDARKIGSFTYVNASQLGREPAILVVLAIDGPQTAEVVLSQKGLYNAKLAKMEAGSLWRFITANIAGDKLDFVPRDGGGHYTYRWSDANSGSFSSLNESSTGNKGNIGVSERFMRLDG